MNVTTLKPVGFCYGVISAIDYAKKIKKEHQDKNVYIFGLLVHNNDVTKYLESFDIHTIDTSKINEIERLNKFNKDDIVIFTAHGHNFLYEKILKDNGVTYYDAICPRVKQNVDIILNTNEDVIYIGKKGHAETEAALTFKDNVHLYNLNDKFDYSKIKSKNPLVINQTTLSFLEISHIHEDIKKHLENANILDEICHTTKNRQEKILNIKQDFDLLVVVGSKVSSNSTKLYELAKNKYQNKEVIFVENTLDLKNYDLTSFKNALVASGTSTPLTSIEEVIEKLREI